MIYRTVACDTWGDLWFEDLPPHSKLVFLYLLTNPRTNAAGAYEITTARIAFDTRIDEDLIGEILRVDLAAKVWWWPELQIVWVRNFFKRQKANSNGDNFAAGARKALAALPSAVQGTVGAYYPELALPPLPIPPTPATNGAISHPHAIPMPPPTQGDKETVTGSGSVIEIEPVESLHAQPPPPAPTGAKAPKSRGTRLPDRFLLTAEMRKWATTNTPAVNVADETAAFCDYWRAVPGQRGCKLDWPATWRNWMRQEQKKLTRYPPTQNGGQTHDKLGAKLARIQQQIAGGLTYGEAFDDDQGPDHGDVLDVRALPNPRRIGA